MSNGLGRVQRGTHAVCQFLLFLCRSDTLVFAPDAGIALSYLGSPLANICRHYAAMAKQATVAITASV